MSKCLFCQKPMMNKLEQHVKACSKCIVDLLSKKHNLKVIYDAAHCFAVKYKGESIFNYGDVSTCSFHATKLFHTGEGGAVFCNDEEIYHELYYRHNFGHNGPYDFHGIGINAKISELQSAMGLSVLPYIDQIIIERAKVVDYYINNLDWTNLKKIKLREGTEWNYSYFPIIFDTEANLIKTQTELNNQSIYPRRYFFPSLNIIPFVNGESCPKSEDIAKRVLCLPLFDSLSLEDIDFIIKVGKIGNKDGIISGTTEVTKNPVGVKIASNTSKLLKELGLIKQGFSFQSGAGGVSLRVTKDVRDIMLANNIKASFFSGGITKYHVDMLEEGLVEKLYDVQCFDLDAVKSLSKNKEHYAISASKYANPSDPSMVIKDLDVVILGATEIDKDFNVNVTTDSHGNLIGGSGGHSDTASEAKVTVIVSPLIKGRIPVVKDKVTTITTLGKNIDCFVCERGIAINPLRVDLIEKLKDSRLHILSIDELLEIAHNFTGIPKNTIKHDRIIGEVEDRTFEIIDYIYQK